MQLSLYRQMLHFHLFPCIYHDALFIFPCFLVFLHRTDSSFSSTCILKYCMVPSVQHCCSCLNTCNTETDVQALNCSHKNFQGLFTQDRIFVEFDILYRQTEKHIWHNHSGTSGCDQVSSEVVRCPCLCIFYWIACFGTSQFPHSAIIISKLPPSYKLFFLNNCCWALELLQLTLKQKKINVLKKTLYYIEQLRSKVRMYVFTCMQAKCDNL